MHRRLNSRGLVLLLASAGFAGLAAGQPATTPSALPLDLAFSARTIRLWDRPALSRDGSVLSFDVYSPPLRSPESQVAEGVRFLPGGTPSEMMGLRTFVVPTTGGEPRPVCPENANCWRSSPSPDGSRVVFFCDSGGPPQLWVYEAKTAKSRRVAEAPIKAKHWPGDEAAWGPDGREVFVGLRPAGQPSPGAPLASTAGAAPTGAPDKPAVTVYSTGPAAGEAPAGPPVTPEYLAAHFLRENNVDLAAVEIATGKVRVIVPADAEPRPSCLRLSPDGRWVSYLSVFRMKGETASTSYYDLAVAPASGGKPAVIAADVQVPEGSYFEDTYRWLPDSRRIVYLKDKKLWLADVSAPGAAPRQLGAALGNLEETPLAVSADGDAVLVGQEAEGEKTYYSVPPRALALVPVDGSTPTTFASVGTPVLADRDTLWRPGPGRFAIVVNDEATGDRSVLSVDAHSGATTTLWKGRGRIDVVGAAGGGVVARFEALDTPPNLYRFDAGFASKRRLSHAEPRLDGVTVGPMQAFASDVPGFDGRLLSVQTAVFLPPGGKAGDRLPGIVYFYSGSKMSSVAQEYGGGAPNSIPVQVFATRGYAVLLVDVPLGPEGKGGNPIQEMADVILPQVYRAAERRYVDPSRMAIMGQSYGGYSTAAMVTQTNLFRAAIALDGLYDLAGDYGRMGPGGGNFGFVWSETGQGRMGTHPWGDLRRYVANSPYYQADKVHTPLLLIHGKKDETCAVEGAEKMFNALKRLGRTAQLAVYDGEGHVPGTWSLVNAVDATQRMVDWLARYDAPAGAGGAAAKP